MPTIARLRLCTILMYFGDHNPPHFHVRDRQGAEALVAIETLTVLRGAIDRRALVEALDWGARNRDALREIWRVYSGA